MKFRLILNHFIKNMCNKMKYLFFYLTIVIAPFGLQAQVVEEWVARYDFSGNYDEAHAIAVDESGGVYVTGKSEQSFLNFDCATVMYDAYGSQKWDTRFNGPDNQQDIGVGIDVNIFSDECFVLAQSHNKYITFRLSAGLGIEQWQRIVNDANGASALVLDNTNMIYVTGAGYAGGNAGNDFTTVKYSNLGAEQWLVRYGGPDSLDDGASDVAVDSYGNVYVTGSIGGFLNIDYATVKYNHLGAFQWAQTYNGPADFDDGAVAIAVDDSGNVYVTGSSEQSYGVRDYATIKYNSEGVQQWINRYNLGGDDVAKDIAVDSEGNVYVTGWSEGIGTSIDYATIKYNSAGVQQWVARYNGPDSLGDGAFALALDASGNVYVTGASTNNWYEDCVTVKYNSNGSEIWVQRYDGPGNTGDQGRAITVDDDGNVYVTGSSFGDGTKTDYVTIKYSQPTGVEQYPINIPEGFNLKQNYPNPFNPSTKIKYSIPSNRKGGMSNVILKVCDILGNEIATLVNEEKPAGIYEVEFNGADLSSGIYFYQLKAAEFIQTKKMILLK